LGQASKTRKKRPTVFFSDNRKKLHVAIPCVLEWADFSVVGSCFSKTVCGGGITIENHMSKIFTLKITYLKNREIKISQNNFSFPQIFSLMLSCVFGRFLVRGVQKHRIISANG
jgi:hypothetical protein